METMNPYTGYQPSANAYPSAPDPKGYLSDSDPRAYPSAPDLRGYSSDPDPLSKQSFDQFQKLTDTGFVPLTKKEREEAKRAALEAGFSFEGYQVVRREFISHRFDPTLTIKNNSITFNNTCISRMDEVVYIQVLVNPVTQTLVVRPCEEGARDAIRWCIAKNQKRKSRQITCKPFMEKLYSLMGWETLYRYKLQGFQITYHGEKLYVFDLTSKEAFLPQTRDPKNSEAKRKAPKPVYPPEWQDSFGMPVEEHTASTQVNLMEGYSFSDEVSSRELSIPVIEAEVIEETEELK